IQKQILSLIRNLAREQEVAVLLITHDMGVIAETTNTISILRNGHLVEDGDTSDVLGRPQKAYTRNLIYAVPRIDRRLDRFSAVLDESAEITTDMNSRVKTKEVARTWLLENRSGSTGSDSQTLEISDLSVVFSSRPSLFVKKQQFRAVNRLNLAVRAGETLGLVGESGSGKSTVAKTIVGIHRAAAGSIFFRNQKVDIQNKRKRDDPTRRSVQMIFQDPYSSLNNRWKIYDIVAEPLKFYKLHDGQLPEEKIVSAMIELVGLPTDSLYKYPHQFSGGQRQRIAIARALIARPEFLICDEPTSALDVTVQAIILNLIKDIQDQFNLSILFISHDLPVIRQMADEIAVMKAGEIVEYGPCESFFAEPQHVYSRALLADIPSLDLLGQPNNA
ncbi:MAG: ABC transporter ATP-binding protein, partial [Methyloligellaceae bacterium]